MPTPEPMSGGGRGRRALPADIARYVDELVAAAVEISERSAGGLAGAHVVGSLALGGYRAGLSDVDLVVVTEAPLDPDARSVLADRALAVPCPTRGLELVVYHRAALARPRVDGAYDLNVNGGPAMDARRSLDPAGDPAFWFVIDRDIARRHGRTVHGAPPAELVAAVPRDGLLDALGDGLAWAGRHAPASGSSVLNACRTWRRVERDDWASKEAAGTWALARTAHPVLVERALAARRGHAAPADGPLDARPLLDEAAAALDRAR